ncbi:acyl-CoA dehydrogenase family protein [Pseudomonas salmasensis]|uniref:Acyl-CoA dehydrogenase family protein n=1 Tax=Pseudomonas salmasensis TaxID=2745514 RepID=A0ABU5FIF3_9PSED|nr:acyl-CoA dehydrogenase family protein [Pseudomonas salmasensis]MDY4301518.1 acyl-CoA dehydrogenase family protein [Pseudomonas salmasensis]
MDKLFQQLLRSPLFEPRQRHYIHLKTYMDLTIKRMHALFGTGLINNDLWLGQPRQSEFASLCELMGYLGAFDYALHSSVVDHMIAVDALFNHGSAAQVKRYRDEAVHLHKVYAFGCTEVAVGTDVRNVRTTVTYNRQTHDLVLDSPSPEACKCWIGNAFRAAQVVMVLARLIVDGEDQGHHWFRVVIRQRENGRLRNGVKIMACDPKGGIHANQVAAIRFCQMRLPLDALLQRHARFTDEGTFVSDLPLHQRFVTALKTFLQERLLFMAGIRHSAGLTAHLSYRFALHRLLHAPGGQVTLLSQPLFRQRLYAVQLKALALKYLEQAVRKRFEAEWAHEAKRKELHVLAAVCKAVGAWQGLEVMARSRELCGSQGFHHYNQVVTQRMDCEIANTFAGDSSVMAYQVIKDALARPRFVDSPPNTIGQRVEAKIIGECLPPAGFTHGQALGVVYARALDLVIQEVEDAKLLTPATVEDLIGEFADYLYPWGVRKPARAGLDVRPQQIEALAMLLKPPQILVSALIDCPDYIQQFTRTLYEEQ